MHKLLSLCGIAVALCLDAGVLMAQDATPAEGNQGNRDRGRGNFDPAQFQQRVMDNIKARMGMTNETWEVIQPLVQKIMDARREVGSFGRFGRRGSESPPSGGDSNSQRRSAGDSNNVEGEVLQKAIDSNSPAAQIRASLEKYREVRKEKKVKLEQAQEELRKVLSVKQEAQAVLLGLLE